MAHAKITLLTLYKYMQSDGTDIFSELSLPSGIDKDMLIDNILLRGGEFEVLFSNPEFMQYMTGVWSKKWYRTFQKWLDALNVKYDPLNNFDRYEEWEEDRKDDESNQKSGVNNRNMKSTQRPNQETKYDVSAYDQSADYSPKDKTTISGENIGEGSENLDSFENGKRDLKGNVKHKGHLYGNIGVTTSQQMLESELNIAEWNIYEHITDLYLNEFVIYTY